MANDLTTYPLQVDTAFTSGLTTPVLIRMMVWTGGTTAGHTVTVTGNTATDVIWKAHATGNGDYVAIDFTHLPGGGYYAGTGIEVATIDSGNLLIYT